MMTLQELCAFLEQFAPARLAEEWDNVGLLVGDPARPITRVMTCLTITPASAREAVEEQADVIVTHHPRPFRAMKRLTTETVPGRLLLELIGAKIAIHSPHTAFDSAAAGINQRLAEGLSLLDIRPLQTRLGEIESIGNGRLGRLAAPRSLREVAQQVRKFLKVDGLHQVGSDEQSIRSIAVACGSAGQFLDSARRAGCDLLVTGETSFHTCLEAEAEGVALLLPGHYASERFGVEALAEVLKAEFKTLKVWASQREADPLTWKA
jgi:dinuclear metal center YbgI/SA1388 family protein